VGGLGSSCVPALAAPADRYGDPHLPPANPGPRCRPDSRSRAQRGIVEGHQALRRLLLEVARRKPPARRYARNGYLTDGRRLIWEYPRETADADQMDFVEVMELNAQGLIQRHRVYWG
jgi:hypothetical protein